MQLSYFNASLPVAVFVLRAWQPEAYGIRSSTTNMGDLISLFKYLRVDTELLFSYMDE